MSAAVKATAIGQSTNDKLMLFVSDIGKSYSGSPRAIYEYICETGLASEFTIVWAFNKPELFKNLGCKTVKLDSVEYFRIALTAKYWITDVNIERGLKFKRPQTKYLNTWHGSTMKTLGNDIHGRIYYDCSSIDWLCVNSEYDVSTFKRAFRIDEKKFIRTGLPKNDYLFVHRNDSSAVYKRKLGFPDDKRIILYAPTWRDSNDGGKSYTIAPPISLDKWKEALSDRYVLVFRMHPLTLSAMGIVEDDFCRNYSGYQPLNDLLLASDILITDYSSIAFDYSILKRPTLCFSYDEEDYRENRGLYIDLNSVYPLGTQQTEDDLLECIAELDKYGLNECPTISGEYNEYGGDATRMCCEYLLGKQ